MAAGVYLDKERLDRAAGIYKTNRAAAIAIGVSPGAFGRACRRFGILTPQERQKKRRGCD